MMKAAHLLSHKALGCLLCLSLFFPLGAQPGPDQDPTHARVEAQLDSILSLSYHSRDSALHLLQGMLQKYQASGFSFGYARALSLKSWIVSFEAQYKESLKLGHRALSLQKKMGDSTGIALTLNRIGSAHLQFDRLEDANEYIGRALGYFTALKDSSRMEMCFNNLGVVARRQGFLKNSIQYYQSSLHILTALKSYTFMGYTQYNIALVHLDMNQPDSAEHYLEQALYTFKTLAEVPVPPMVNEGYGKLQLELGHLAKAEAYTRKALQGAREQGHEEIILSATRQLADILFGQGRYREAFLTKDEYLEMKSRIDSANSAVQVAEIEERYQNVEKEAEISRLKAQKLGVENRAQRARLAVVYVGGAALILLLAMGLVVWRRRQRQQIHESQLQARMADIRLVALRAQMNPHFIFNCIHTAQNFVLASQKEEAHRYLHKFSRLLRLVLHNSNRKFVPVADEVEQLRLYIELESVRFNHPLHYQLDISPGLEEGPHEIPGMLLQPLVENAIVHGLANRSREGASLTIALTEKEGLVECVIEDNGVGRKRAAEIKAAHPAEHESTAVANIKERLETLQKETGTELKMETTDLFENGLPSGTRVSLKLPFHA